MNDFDQILQNYVSQILKIQQERTEAPLKTEELKRIAENLGLSDNDWQHIQSTFEASLARGKSFVQYKSWDNAIKELQLAVKINPAQADALYHLALAHWQRNRNSRKKTDLKQAEVYARRCVQADYTHDAALRLISRLEKQKTPKTSPTNRVIISMVLIAAVGISAYIIWDISRDRAPVNKLPVHTNATPPLTTPKSTEPVIVKTPDNKNVLDLPVTLRNANDNATGLELDLENSLYRRGDYEMLYQLRGSIKSKVFEVSQLTLRLKLVDRNGEIKFEKDFEVLDAEKDIPIRPGDYIPFAKIFRQQTFPPHFKDALLSVVKISKTSPEGKYEPARLVPLQWEQSPPVGINVEVRLREETMIPNSDKFSHDFVLEVKNTGTLTIKSLKVDMRWFNEKDKLAYNEEMTLVASSNAMLKPQQTRLKKGGFMVGLKKSNYKDFDLTILEIK